MNPRSESISRSCLIKNTTTDSSFHSSSSGLRGELRGRHVTHQTISPHRTTQRFTQDQAERSYRHSQKITAKHPESLSPYSSSSSSTSKASSHFFRSKRERTFNNPSPTYHPHSKKARGREGEKTSTNASFRGSRNACSQISKLRMDQQFALDELYQIYSTAKNHDYVNKFVIVSAWSSLGRWIKGKNGFDSQNTSIVGIILQDTFGHLHLMSSREISNIYNAIGWMMKKEHHHKIQCYSDQLNTLIHSLTEPLWYCLKNMNPQDIANTVWGLATIGVNNPELLNALAQQAIERVRDMNSQDVANIVWSYATLGITNQILMETLAERAIELHQGMDPQSIANIMWAYATLNTQNRKLMDVFAERTLQIYQHMSPQNIANIAWAFASTRIEHKPLMDTLANRAIELYREMSAKSVSEVAWAFAVLEIVNLRLMQVLAIQAQHLVQHMHLKEISHTAWAFSSLKIKDEALMHALANRTIELHQYMSPYHMCTIASSFAVLRITNYPLIHVLAQRAIALQNDLSEQEISSIASSFGNLEICDPLLMQALADRAQHLSTTMTLTSASKIIWAFARLKFTHHPFINVLADKLLNLQIHQDYTRDLAQIIWSFAHMGIKHDSLMNALANQALQLCPYMNPQSVSNTIWAFAHLGIHHEPLMTVLAIQTLQVIRMMNPQELSNTAWSFARLNWNDETFFQSLIKNYPPDSSWSRENLTALSQVFDYCEAKRWNIEPPQRLTYEIASCIQRPPESSQLHLGVSDVLSYMGISYKNECLIGSSWVDIFIQNRNLVVEVDGPYHDNQGVRDEFKTRLLAMRGYSTIRISYKDWNQCQTLQSKAEFLNKKLGLTYAIPTSSSTTND